MCIKIHAYRSTTQLSVKFITPHIPKLYNPVISTITITLSPLHSHDQHPIFSHFNLSSAIQIGMLEGIYLL